MSLATKRSTVAVAVEVGRDDPESASVGVDDARLGRHVARTGPPRCGTGGRAVALKIRGSQ